MLNYLQTTAARERGADIPGMTATPAGTANQPHTAAKKKKKKKKPLATATAAEAVNPASASCLTAAKAAAETAEQAAAEAAKAAKAADEAAKAADEAAKAADETAKAAGGAAMEAANATRAARAAAEAAAEAVKAAEMLVAADQETEAAKATPEEAIGAGYESDNEYEKSLAGKTFLYVPVEGAIQVRTRSGATKEEILEWPYTEGHGLAVPNYILTGYIRSFNFDGPINKRYSKLYGPTARIHGPAIIYNENGRVAVSLTEEDIPKIFRHCGGI
ncbi:hypothetical protein BGZ70_000533 [Mortierella alpina]|uniref:Uncharacterized protein n=1 Tax=Mortierella alpina TaxID=64518 RepID=A0A9P6IY90_MORAP|nr:hypothetical protein BGZ70_000533 [Mortierella alpina]